MHVDEQQLESFIVDSGVVGAEEMSKLKKEAEAKQVSLGRVVVTKGVLSDDDLRRMQAYLSGLSFVDLRNRKIDFSVLSLIPEPIARNHNIVAFKKNKDSLEVALLDIKDLSAVDFLRQKLGLKILPRLTDTESIKWALLSYQKMLKAEFGDIIQRESSSSLVVDTLLKHALLQGASDIHIEPLETQTVIRYRLGGALKDAMVLPKGVIASIGRRLKELVGIKTSNKAGIHEGRFKITNDGESVSFRLSLLPAHHGERMVLRIFRDNVSGFTLESLGFGSEDVETLHQALHARKGLVIITGGAQSGKTTTLYTMLDLLNTPEANIVTIEDPIEHHMVRVNQSQVNSDTGFNFPSGLRTILRHDPDIIMISELRDRETVNLAIEAALRGHLVLAALPAPSLPQAIEKLLDMKVDLALLNSALSVVVNQKLVNGVGTHEVLNKPYFQPHFNA